MAPQYDIRTLQLRILRILLAIDQVCREHDLRYYIVAGTMLGAVRHGGFIPWDDDLDIGMPRPDYDRLMERCAEWLPSPYQIIAYETDARYPFPFAKAQDSSTTLVERAHMHYIGGIYIDIFPLDGMTANPLRQRLHLMRYRYLRKVQYLLYRDPYRHGRGPSSWVPLLCRRLYTLDEVQRKMKAMQKEFDYERESLVIDHDFGSRGVMSKQLLGEPTPILFEGQTVMGVACPDEYLSRIYGDYMQLPPEEKRKQHLFYYLDLETPFDSKKEVH